MRFKSAATAYRAQLRFCLRMTLAGLLAFALGQILAIPLHGLWVVLTALVVTQMSVGGSLRATVEYIIGTVGGAVYGGIVGILVPHSTAVAAGGALALTIAPLAFLAAYNKNFRVAPFSAVLVLVLSGQFGGGPIDSALYRLLEVVLGGAAAVTVSLLVFPERAGGLALQAAARIVVQLADTLPQLFAGFTADIDPAAIRHVQNDIGKALATYQAMATEAENEHVVNLTAQPDYGPLSRTLLRLRHDYVIIGRAATAPLPPTVTQCLAAPLAQLGERACEFLRGCASALTLRRDPPALDALAAAHADYSREIDALRSAGATRAISSTEVERVFALGFAIEQLHQNFIDLARCVKEFSQGAKKARASVPGPPQ